MTTVLDGFFVCVGLGTNSASVSRRIARFLHLPPPTECHSNSSSLSLFCPLAGNVIDVFNRRPCLLPAGMSSLGCQISQIVVALGNAFLDISSDSVTISSVQAALHLRLSICQTAVVSSMWQGLSIPSQRGHNRIQLNKPMQVSQKKRL